MADIVTVSDSLNLVVTRIERHLDLSQTVIISDALSRSKLDIKWIPQFVFGVNDSVDRVVQSRPPQNIIRIISEQTLTITETIELYKNDVLVEPVAEIPTPQNILGTRERRVRAPRRPPRAIVIDEVVNVAIAPLKLLAFTETINKAIVGIRPRNARQNVALSRLSLARSPLMITQSSIKTSPQPMILKAKLALASSPQLTTQKLRLRPELQSIVSLKAINGERVDKLHKLVLLAMMIENV
jgi:hypothetical protein